MEQSRTRIWIKGKCTEEDRLAVATVLVRSGYTVRIGREKRNGEKSMTYYVEYFEETEK